MFRRRVAALPALADKRLRLLGRRRRAARPRRDPALGLLQHRRAQQQPVGPLANAQRRACSPNSVCCLIQAMSVSSASASRSALSSNRASSSKNTKLSLASASGTALSSTRRQTIGREALVERGRERDLSQRHLRGHRIGAQHEHDRVGAARSAPRCASTTPRRRRFRCGRSAARSRAPSAPPRAGPRRPCPCGNRR